MIALVRRYERFSAHEVGGAWFEIDDFEVWNVAMQGALDLGSTEDARFRSEKSCKTQRLDDVEPIAAVPA